LASWTIFVVVSRNRAEEQRQVLADHQWRTVQQEQQQNEELLRLSNQILELTGGHPRAGRGAVAGQPGGVRRHLLAVGQGQTAGRRREERQ
jgi:hypothetical protein